MKKPPPGRKGALAVSVTRKAVPKKKGAAGKKGAPAKKVAPKKKPVPKKPPPGLTGHALAAHKAHEAHLAHLAHLGLRPKPAPVHHRRQLALGEGVACCAAEALAASLRLTGRPVSDADVLALYRRTAGDPDAGASILATLEAAYEYGLGSWRLMQWEMAGQDSNLHPPISGGYALGPLRLPHGALSVGPPAISAASLILGVELPGSHAVLATPDGWWSWGELYEPDCWPDAVIEEAWTLTWD